MSLLVPFTAGLFAQVKTPTTTPGTTVPNPIQEPVNDLRNLGDACKTNPSSVCTWVLDKTDNYFLAGFADWFVAKPLTILVIVLLAWLANRIVRRVIKRSTQRMLRPSEAKTVRWLRDKSPNVLLKTEQVNLRTEARVQTLSTVFRGIATAIIWMFAVVLILDVLEVNLGPIVATAGIIGVALGFGAQYLVRDFLSGTFMVIEDQFGVGDIVDLGEAKGTVEKVTLRVTRVRDVNGVVWHVPNGQITRVANKSQEWARAVLDIEVDYDADLDLAQQVIQDTADALSVDEDWQGDILETPEVWGIENFTADGVAIRLVIKTQPASQFGVMRELRSRLKAALDEHGIGLSAAHNDVWVHLDDGAAPAAATDASLVSDPPTGEVAPPVARPASNAKRGDPSETG